MSVCGVTGCQSQATYTFTLSGVSCYRAIPGYTPGCLFIRKFLPNHRRGTLIFSVYFLFKICFRKFVTCLNQITSFHNCSPWMHDARNVSDFVARSLGCHLGTASCQNCAVITSFCKQSHNDPPVQDVVLSRWCPCNQELKSAIAFHSWSVWTVWSDYSKYRATEKGGKSR